MGSPVSKDCPGSGEGGKGGKWKGGEGEGGGGLRGGEGRDGGGGWLVAPAGRTCQINGCSEVLCW